MSRFQNSKPSWFGFMLTARENAPFTREDVVRHLEGHGIQTRMLFAGNLIKHPCFDSIRGTGAYRVSGELPVTDRIMEDSFWIGLGPVMDEKRLERMVEVIHEAVAEA